MQSAAAIQPASAVDGTAPISWSSAPGITIYYPSGLTYSNEVTAASAAGTMIFKFTPGRYNYQLQNYSILSYTVSATHLTTTTAITISCDTFPDVPLLVSGNYEVSNTFYRLTSATAFNYKPTLIAPLTAFDSHILQYSINGGAAQVYPTLTSFNVTTPCLCTVTAQLSTNTLSGSLYPLYSSHIWTNTTSAIFVSAYPTGTFIASTSSFFVNQTLSSCNFSTFTTTPGLSFIGEGHTEYILLSTFKSAEASGALFNISNTGTTNVSAVTAVIPVPTIAAQNNSLALRLQTYSPSIPSSAPTIYYDDVTGQPKYYPYITSTVDVTGTELVSNTAHLKSLQVLPYAVPLSSFNAGMAGDTYLNSTGSTSFGGTITLELSGAGSSDTCFEKYGLVWRWTNFTLCSAWSSLTPKPSTWETVSSTNAFPKLWMFQPATSAPYDVSPITYTQSTTQWTLSTAKWEVATSTPAGAYTYVLSYDSSNYGYTPLTVDSRSSTPIIVSASDSVVASINVGPADWLPRTLTVADASNATIQFQPVLSFYTPNRLAIQGANIFFQNLSIVNSETVAVQLLFDSGEIVNLVGTENFAMSFSELGYRSFTAIAKDSGGNALASTQFDNFVLILSQYDEVDTDAYTSRNSPLNLPYPIKPYIYPNEWVVEDVPNSCIQKIYDNLMYLESRATVYAIGGAEYFGWLGSDAASAATIYSCPDSATWSDLECTGIRTDVTWDVWECVTGTSCTAWGESECSSSGYNPTCFGKYCVAWSWLARKQVNTTLPITWKQARSTGAFAAKWVYEPCTTSTGGVALTYSCNTGKWHVNIPLLDTGYNPITRCDMRAGCTYTGVQSRDNIIFATNSTSVRVLSSDYNSTPVQVLTLADNIFNFGNISGISIDSRGKVYVIDSLLNKVYVYNVDATLKTLSLFTSWGGLGGAISQARFQQPNDIHLDQYDTVWVADTGNLCIKQYSNTGAWLQTIILDQFSPTNRPLSVALDSSNILHILCDSTVIMSTMDGTYISSYGDAYVSNAVKLNTSVNREIIYIAAVTAIYKFFRTGVFFEVLLQDQTCATNIAAVMQDEFRNVLIASGTNIIKYNDRMALRQQKGLLPPSFLPAQELFIHKQEYVQDWVYNKSFQRLWDNIEIFRNTLFYSNSACKTYTAPTYSKTQVKVGQNEIVTNLVINRLVSYLWTNLESIINYFDPNCK